MSEITTNPGPSVMLTNENIIDVTSQEQLTLSEKLSPRARNAMILPGLKVHLWYR